MAIDYTEVGKRIRGLRGKVRQIDWVKKLGCSQGYLSQVERGVTKPSLEFLVTISRITGVDIDWILTGNIPPEVSTHQVEDQKPPLRFPIERRTRFRRKEDQLLFWARTFLQKPDALAVLDTLEQVLKLGGMLVFSPDYHRLKSLLVEVKQEVS